MVNKLITQKSPYLLQHAHNPIDWFPWGREAFDIAKRDNKPIFLSIGYSSCYWCHVMEHDSFESEEIASFINSNFISIKLDREERPDLDSFYMDFVVALNGHGGWPLSLFLLPDKRPFWGGTFFRSDQFIKILHYLSEIWSKDRERIELSASSAFDALSSEGDWEGSVKEDQILIERAVAATVSRYDHEYGGFGDAPKFPSLSAIKLLLRVGWREKKQELINIASHSLKCMISGGIYDHIEGGLARYSTDRSWMIPHFEKMLYDNALLCAALSDAFLVSKDPIFSFALEKTLSFIEKRMLGDSGLGISALDAGDVGNEGHYYGYTEEQLRAVLTPEELSQAKFLFNLSERGNFEGQLNILSLQASDRWIDLQSRQSGIIIEKLSQLRSSREHPRIDDKSLVGWNGLLISAFVSGFRALKDPHYLQRAESIVNFLLKNMFVEGALKRRYREGDVDFDGCLEDYACFISGLLDLYSVTANVAYREVARTILLKAIELFWDEKNHLFFNSHAEDLVIRKQEVLDGATPSDNGVMLLNLLIISRLDSDLGIKKIADQLKVAVKKRIDRHEGGGLTIGISLFDSLYSCAVTIYGEHQQYLELIEKLSSEYHPGLIFNYSSANNMVGMELCCGDVCYAPTSDVSEVLKTLEEYEGR